MTWPPSKPLACSSGEKFCRTTRWEKTLMAARKALPPLTPRDACRWQSGRAVATATSLISTIPCRFWQMCQALRATGIERIDPFVLVFCWGGLIQTGWEKKEGVRKRGREWKTDSSGEQTWSATPFLLFPLCNQRDIAGGKLWELSLPTGPRASCRVRWLTERPQLGDLWCSCSVHISHTQSAAWTQFLHHPSDYFQ